MNLKKILYVSLAFVLLGYTLNPVKLKSNDLEKANTYYENFDYSYAIDIYEKLFRKKATLEIAEKLANCYRLTGKSIEAEEIYSKVLAFPGFNPVNYLYYAEMLKQNSKFDEAKHYYLMYGERIPEKADYAFAQANSCDAARLWLANPDRDIFVNNVESLNSNASDFSPVIYSEGIVFSSDRSFIAPHEKKSKNKISGWTGNAFIKIYKASKESSSSEYDYKVSVFPSNINQGFHNGPAIISWDGKTLFFTKSRDVKINELRKAKNPVVRKGIYFSQFKNGLWENPQPFPFNDLDNYSVQHPALSQDGNILYFSSDRPGGYGGMDLYYSIKQGGNWSEPVNCGSKINTSSDEAFPYVRSDGKFYFSSKGHITLGGFDLFSVNGEKNQWDEPENLKAPINSPKDDFGITFFEDNLTGFFTSNRVGGKGFDDIYRFSKTAEPQKLILAVEGTVVEKGANNPMSGLNVYLVNKNTGETKQMRSRDNGSFYFELEPETDYVLRGDLDKFFSRQEGEISTKGVKESTVFNVKFEVEKGEDAYLVKLNNIYYDFDRYNIRKDAEPELQKVAALMSKLPNVSIELHSHTDARGSSVYNMALSEKRAHAAKTYLVKQGADNERLSAKGFGKTKLLNSCSSVVKCTEKEHQLNRRTEFKVIRVSPTHANQPAPVLSY